MRSQYADKFNHDEDACGYDEDVRDEGNPIREGYSATLAWVSERAKIRDRDVVVDLGCGTGNLAQHLPAHCELHCVDISENMLALARKKLNGKPEVNYICSDLLAYFEDKEHCFDRVVSTYAVHHLTQPEKGLLFMAVARSLRPGGRVAFGDLMFESDPSRDQYLEHLRRDGNAPLADEIEDEFFWSVDHAIAGLQQAGFATEHTQISTLSWGISGRLTP